MAKNTALRAEDSKRKKMFHTVIRHEKMAAALLFECHYLMECSDKGGVFPC